MVDKRKVRRQIFSMILPIVLENFLQTSATLVTTAMIGRLIADDISAQGIAVRIYNTFYMLLKGLAIGATVVVALYYGQGRIDRCRRTVEQGYITAVPFTLIFSLFIAFCPSLFVSLFTQDAAIMSRAVGYMSVMGLSLPFVAIITMTTAGFQGQGNTRTPMFVAVFVNIVNIVFGYGLIFGNFGMPELGLIGGAIAFLIAQITGAALELYLFYHRRGPIHAAKHGESFWKFDLRYLKEIYTTGIPAACENVFYNVATIIISRVVLSYGTESYAAYQLGLQAEGLLDMLAAGFITASATLAASSIGKRDDPLFREYLRQMLIMAVGLCLFSVPTLLFFPEQFMMLLTDKAELIAIGRVYLMIMAVAQLPQNLSKSLNGFIRASGYKKTPMLISFAGLWLVRVPFCCLIGWVLVGDITWIWWAVSLDQVVRATLSVLVVWRCKIANTVQKRIAEDEAAATPAV